MLFWISYADIVENSFAVLKLGVVTEMAASYSEEKKTQFVLILKRLKLYILHCLVRWCLLSACWFIWTKFIFYLFSGANEINAIDCSMWSIIALFYLPTDVNFIINDTCVLYLVVWTVICWVVENKRYLTVSECWVSLEICFYRMLKWLCPTKIGVFACSAAPRYVVFETASKRAIIAGDWVPTRRC